MLQSFKDARKGFDVSLRRIRLDKGGYEIGTGHYYGRDQPLYRLYIGAYIQVPGSPHVRALDDTREFRASARDCAEALAVEYLISFKNTI